MAADPTSSDGMVRAFQGPTAGQTFTANGLHLVALDTIDWDPDNAFSPFAGVGGNGYRYTAPTDGYYLLMGRVGAIGTAAGDCMQARIEEFIGGSPTDIVRGTSMTLTAQDITNNTVQLISLASDVRWLNQGDLVQLYLDLLVAAAGLTTITGTDKTYFNAIRLL